MTSKCQSYPKVLTNLNHIICTTQIYTKLVAKPNQSSSQGQNAKKTRNSSLASNNKISGSLSTLRGSICVLKTSHSFHEILQRKKPQHTVKISTIFSYPIRFISTDSTGM